MFCCSGGMDINKQVTVKQTSTGNLLTHCMLYCITYYKVSDCWDIVVFGDPIGGIKSNLVLLRGS